MGELYHGSHMSGIKRLEPNHSTHGKYVYATPYKELAIIFAQKCGDDLTYTIYRNGKNEKWKIVERIPDAFDIMFNNDASLYTLSDTTFKDIHTGFAELVSEVGVDTTSETHIPSVYDAIKELEQQDLIEIYNYPDRPIDIPKDDTDLIQKEIRQCQRTGKKIEKRNFERLIYLHPNLIDEVNKLLISNNQEIYNPKELINIFEQHLVAQMLDSSREQYITSSVQSISNFYPELIPDIKEKLDILYREKNEKIGFILSNIEKKLLNLPKELISQAMAFYLTDERDFSTICNEINMQLRKYMEMEKIVSKDISLDVLDNSILVIGPMGTGKSVVSDNIGLTLNMPKISLDDRKQLEYYYKNRNYFDNFKDFEFYLASSVLTNLKEPSVVDFGAGHSVYENPIMFYEFQKLIKRFSNVVYMIPSDNKDEAIEILNARVKQRNANVSDSVLQDNIHFINMECNETLSTIKKYTKDKSIEELTNEIISDIQNKKIDEANLTGIIHKT